MTDNEIIKALECCSHADCENCPQWSEEWYNGRCNDFLWTVIDLIKQQQAEIKRLKKLSEFRRNYMGYFPKLERDKAIKEFAERLCAGRVSNDPVVIAAKCLVEEMVGGL